MPQTSTIEWTDATWNPVTGCSKVSQGCKNCYAEAYFARPYPGRKFTDVRIHPERLDWPLRWRGSPQAKAEGRPSRIFVNSMSDLFHEGVPAEFIGDVFTAMKRSPHVFQILTKRPERMRNILRELWGMTERTPPARVWLGVSAEDQETADERIPLLLQTPAAVRWVSYEPALWPVDFSKFFRPAFVVCGASKTSPAALSAIGKMLTAAAKMSGATNLSGLDWIVAGGESGPHARAPKPDWFRSVRDQCAAAGVPFFFKQWGAFLPGGQDGPEIGGRQEVNAGDAPIYLGKRIAGRLLDGREHNEFPKV